MTFRPDPKPEPRKKKKRKRIPQVSEKRKHELAKYSKIREAYLNNNPICERCNVKHSDQIHHMRGRIGTALTDVNYFLAVCDSCHKYIEANPKESIKKGWSFPRLSV